MFGFAGSREGEGIYVTTVVWTARGVKGEGGRGKGWVRGCGLRLRGWVGGERLGF